MILNDKLLNLFRDKAAEVQVDLLYLGLGYTASVTSDGGIGVAYTYFEDKKSCMALNEAIDYEGRPATALLEKIKSDNSVERSMALLRATSPATLVAETEAHVVFLGGAPFDGPRHIWWNFVSSSKERIERAKADRASGKFPKVPGDEDEYIPLPG